MPSIARLIMGAIFIVVAMGICLAGAWMLKAFWAMFGWIVIFCLIVAIIADYFKKGT